MYNVERAGVKSRFPRSGAPIALVHGFLHDIGDFAEAWRSNVVYLWEGQVHASDTRRALNRNNE